MAIVLCLHVYKLLMFLIACFHIGIVMESYSPLGNPGNPDLKDADPRVLGNAIVKEIAAKHGATAAQVWYMPAVCIMYFVSKLLHNSQIDKQIPKKKKKCGNECLAEHSAYTVLRPYSFTCTFNNYYTRSAFPLLSIEGWLSFQRL